jgi:hypothetical protein
LPGSCGDGWLSDTLGGLTTLLIGSLAQAAAVTGFIVTQDEAGLFAVAAAFGFGFSGLIRAYILTARQLFPARGELAHPHVAAHRHVGHCGGKLARGRDLRPLRLLRAGVRHRPRIQHRQLRHHRRPRGPVARDARAPGRGALRSSSKLP